MKKICTVCGLEKELDKFYGSKKGKFGKSSWCKDCFNEYLSHKYRNNVGGYKDKVDKYFSKYKKKNDNKLKGYYINRYYRIKEEFFRVYGNQCSCCGESTKEFLTLEHVFGQKGKKKQNSLSAYKDALFKYNPDSYSVLCLNCNHAKGRFGICPHKNKMPSP